MKNTDAVNLFLFLATTTLFALTACCPNSHGTNPTTNICLPQQSSFDDPDQNIYMLGNYLRAAAVHLQSPLRSPTAISRAMSSSADSPSKTQSPETPNQSSSTARLALPDVSSSDNSNAGTRLDVGGQGTTVSLDHLGPIVVNQDGTMSRISNWDQMTESEQKNTLRVLGRRNKQRLEALKAAGVQLGEGSA
ncbi:hypothetical protein BGW36DRAFT_427247 [Talaromyces proteolyticus]|uniref:Uncharacterized protein n=1 Tax=Talaromyces proteolyticus TaxID=1131652 RepID=A0AAD4KQT1_9EURO|nr:uncharacterized protein BGW36DRAFT_427247 [Talaromyces proteolyticus]KAH8697280.1 hypothetical protein BGW36DRAFT_427247 [Talaromyces proteolyticus]